MDFGDLAWLGDAADAAWKPVAAAAAGYGVARWRRLIRLVRRQGPLQIHVETSPQIIYANQYDWITFPQFLPLKAETIPAPPDDTLALSAWAKELGGLPAYHADVQVTLRAWDDLDVIVDTLRVKAYEHTLPDGVVVIKPVGGADLTLTQLDVQLNTSACSVVPRRTGGERIGGLTFRLKPGDVQRFLIRVRPSADYPQDIDAYEWSAFLDLLVGQKRKSVEITDGGRRFVVVNGDRRPMLWWTEDGWRDPI